MLKIDKCGNITITQGDSGLIKQTLYIDATKTNIFRLSDCESVVLSIRAIAGGEPILEKKTSEQHEDGSVLFYFTAKETAALAMGEYVYDTALLYDKQDRKNTYAGGDKIKRTFSIV